MLLTGNDIRDAFGTESRGRVGVVDRCYWRYEGDVVAGALWIAFPSDKLGDNH